MTLSLKRPYYDYPFDGFPAANGGLVGAIVILVVLLFPAARSIDDRTVAAIPSAGSSPVGASGTVVIEGQRITWWADREGLCYQIYDPPTMACH